MANTVGSRETLPRAFPTLAGEQIDRIRPLGRVRQVRTGDVLFQPGDVAVPFFVVLSGRMEIVQPALDGERMIARHEPGEFTGEMTMISGQRCLVIGRVTENGEFLELSGDNLRALVAKDSELSEILMRAFILRRMELIRHGWGNLAVLGSQHSARTLEVREFLTRNGYPYTYIDLDRDQTSQELLDRFEVKAAEVPVVVCNSGRSVLRSPSVRDLAACLGFSVSNGGNEIRDAIVIGAGPAGLAAAVYAASEGLNVLVIETTSPGGQAASSSKIENYLGFPTGVSGQELAGRAASQALKFGAQMMIARSVLGLNCARRPYRVRLDGEEELATRTIVIATGAQYNRPALPNLARFEGNGVYYGATYMESQLCVGDEVAVVGGGNSAGQSGDFFGADREPGTHGGALRRALKHDVAIPHSAARREPEGGIPFSYRDHRTGRRGTSGARDLAGPGDRRRVGACHPPPVPDDGRLSTNRVAEGLLSAGSERLHFDGPRPG
jgi:thioredoxin reductase (NADPH)